MKNCKKNALVLVVILLLCTMPGFAQNGLDTARASTMMREALVLYKNKKASEALSKLDSAGSIYAQKTGKNSLEFSNVEYEKGKIYQQLDEFDHAIAAYNQAIRIRTDNKGIDDEMTGKMMINLAMVYEKKGDYFEAINYLLKAAQVLEKINSPVVASSYINLGQSYSGLGNSENAIIFYKKGIDYLLFHKPDDAVSIATGYLGLTDCYTYRGDYQLAMDAAQQAVAHIVNKYGANSQNLVYVYHSLGKTFITLKQFQTALEYKEKELQLWIQFRGESSAEAGFGYQGIGTCHKYLGNYDLAIANYEKARKNWQGKRGYEEDFALCHNSLGNIYLLKKEYSRALDLYQTALAMYLQYLPPYHPYFIDVYNNLGNCFLEQGNYPQAVFYYKKALDSNRYPGSFEQVVSVSKLIVTLGKLATAENPGSAFLTFRTARKVIEYQRSRLTTGKTELIENALPIFEKNIKTNIRLYGLTNDIKYIQDAFQCMEESRAVGLLEILQDAMATYESNIPDSLLQKERRFNKEIANYEIQKFKAEKDEKRNLTDSALLAINNKLFELKSAYRALKQQFETDYPAYYKQKYDISTISLEELQQQLLQPNQTFIEYMVGDSAVYIFVVKKNDVKLVHVPHDGIAIDSLVEAVGEGLSGYYKLPVRERSELLYTKYLQQYISAAVALHEKLIAPVADMLSPSLIISANGRLGLLPFEVLLSEKPRDISNFNTYNFLIRRYPVSYCYSATLLREMTQKKHIKPPQNDLIAFAPFYTKTENELKQFVQKSRKYNWLDESELLANRKGYGELPFSGPEVFLAAKRWKGSYYIGESANKSTFQQLAGQYNIIHLSTHGVVDNRSGEYSYLTFGNHDSARVYVREIYNMDLNADLVILSACETAVGEVQKGEGVINLSRAFASAGAKSIVTSLWVVNDAASEMLMNNFHEELWPGKSKDEALRQAKLRFMQQHPGEQSHPFFWAGFVGVGDVGRSR